MTDTRPLHERVKALGDHFAAQAAGYRRQVNRSIQDALNVERDAATLHEAAEKLRETK